MNFSKSCHYIHQLLNLPFQQDEVLRQAYEQFGNSGIKNCPDWVKIAKHVSDNFPNLRITNRQCSDRFRSYKFMNQDKFPNVTRGSFSVEEDEIILNMVREWPPGRKGLWIAVGEKLHRPDHTCRSRWTKQLAKRGRQHVLL